MVPGAFSCAASVSRPHEAARCSLNTAFTFTPLHLFMSVGKVRRSLAAECDLGRRLTESLLRRGVLPLLPSCDHRVVACDQLCLDLSSQGLISSSVHFNPHWRIRFYGWTWILYSLSISACLWSKATLGGLYSHPRPQRIFVNQSWLISMSDSSKLKELSK